MPSDLLHEALTRHAALVNPPRGRGFGSPPLTSAFSQLALDSDPSSAIAAAMTQTDDDLIPVQTPAGSRTSSPAPSHASSRSTSPTRVSASLSRPRSGAGKPRRDKTKEVEKEKANKASRDPLNRLPNELSAKCFGYLELDDLLVCGSVCKRWKNSQTISCVLLFFSRCAAALRSNAADQSKTFRYLDYTWYNLLQSLTYTSTPAPLASTPSTAASALLLWTRRDSKIDWSARFASIYRRDDLDDPTNDGERDEDGLTMKEEREQKWEQENRSQQEEKVDKVAMRAYYKVSPPPAPCSVTVRMLTFYMMIQSLGNAKVKGKTGKGAERTWEGDGSGEYV